MIFLKLEFDDEAKTDGRSGAYVITLFFSSKLYQNKLERLVISYLLQLSCRNSGNIPIKYVLHPLMLH